jgi:hypothetical protein
MRRTLTYRTLSRRTLTHRTLAAPLTSFSPIIMHGALGDNAHKVSEEFIVINIVYLNGFIIAE